MTRTVWTAGDPPEAALEVFDGPTELAADHVPTVDQETPFASYRDWKSEDTRVVSCRIANDTYPGRRYNSREEAISDIKRSYGRILEANYVPGRAFFRVYK